MPSPPLAGLLLLLLVAAFPTTALAGPVAFGAEELRRALVARGLDAASPPVRTVIRPGPPESYTVAPNLVTGADARGLMYGLLAAAEQIRAAGRLTPAEAAPQVALRGVRLFRHNEALEAGWYYSREHWNAYFAMLARQRFNRFNLVFAHQTDYLAPPYPYLLDLPRFSGVRVPGVTAEGRRRELETLRFIAQSAADHGIDFTLGIWEHAVPAETGLWPKAVGLTPGIIGPYSYEALKRLLEHCPGIRGVQLRTNFESGIPPERQVAFYRDHVFRAIRESGRPVTLELRGWNVASGMVEAAEASGLPLRVSAKYWAEDLGRPYPPAETFAGYSYENLLAQPLRRPFFWELWGSGSHRLLLWGDPGYVRRAVSTFGLGGASGFEIDPPLAQKGFGDRPGMWGVFTPAELERRRSWTWEWQRYWLFYTLWGRLSFDPRTPAAVWRDELARRFGPAAADVLDAYRNASGVISEIVAAHLANPNAALWPEINPGGLIDAYKQVPASDQSFVASPEEAVANRLASRASAKQTPAETAAHLDRLADATERAVARADAGTAPGNREWASSRPDFRVLAFLARYHARKLRAAEAVAWFDRTDDPGSLARARRELEAALAVWEGLVRLTDGLYPKRMAFGFTDNGHWKDRLAYVRHDLRSIADREEVVRRFGRFDVGFDFGGPVPRTIEGGYLPVPFALASRTAPRFRPVDPGTRYDGRSGYGWLGGGWRAAVGDVAPAPYAEVYTATKAPASPPRDPLFGDAIRGEGPQRFGVRVPPGEYTVVVLRPDRTAEERRLRAEGGRLVIGFRDAWSVSGLIVRGPDPRAAPPTLTEPPPPPPLETRHEPPATHEAGRPLTLALELPAPESPGARQVRAVRLHYRPVNQLARFKTLEAPPSRPVFTIPAADITPRADLMYYFEVLALRGGGWFRPDPHAATPYHVVRVR